MPSRLEAVQPVLMVRDVATALAFYARLGFQVSFTDDPDAPRYAGIRRDAVELFLQWQEAALWSYPIDRPSYRFPVTDVDALHAEVLATWVGEPGDVTAVRDTAWGTREFHLRDPDGNVLQFYRLRDPAN
jgi:catechol 2,3-dioxygenase-like lactoylglutathione lyase family enzyme